MERKKKSMFFKFKKIQTKTDNEAKFSDSNFKSN